ncbi:hypothetical protein A2863_00470 [Candidatus Woesebacteria bacterium RIFCSPHIGHO2_01_FULL_38_9b]|uniref:Glycosyltransferase RgtA/B/C/D-like domain-containing protein n=1 Tax=Candidatus Woesebacteria bacterium RIFCSPHIGHO2_01_FULL_38_9b TaxID=1802493 RepID=A0A1F7Y4B0_9BACT|nr:MAG: hypothetical protein A2863_00470 [Candidatus Woesebacteria bacterium RIFCSPHIGHO2_01_FULL_38_9b]
MRAQKRPYHLLRWLILFSVFFLTRFWILQHPPALYSDVKHDYERYANMWRYGLTPYRQHLYEYPPATIPILSAPLVVDQMGVGHYYLNYRVEIFLFEIVLFSILAYTVFRVPMKKSMQWGAIMFYLIAGVLAKDFWYEGLDLMFFGIFSILFCLILLVKQSSLFSRIVTWSLYWLTVSIKIMTAPLAVPIVLLEMKNWKREFKAIIAGFLIIWGLPLALYRSSLSVFIFFHAVRQMKYASFGSYIVEVINEFTKSEHRSVSPPDFEWIGPVAHQVTEIFKVLFPAAILVVMYIAWKRYRQHVKELVNPFTQYTYLIAVSLAYVFAIFLTGKTFSSPFHIWYIPLLTLFPYKNLKQQWFAYVSALLMLGMDTSSYLIAPKLHIWGSPITLTNVRDAFRFIPMFLLLSFFLKEGTMGLKKS